MSSARWKVDMYSSRAAPFQTQNGGRRWSRGVTSCPPRRAQRSSGGAPATHRDSRAPASRPARARRRGAIRARQPIVRPTNARAPAPGRRAAPSRRHSASDGGNSRAALPPPSEPPPAADGRDRAVGRSRSTHPFGDGGERPQCQPQRRIPVATHETAAELPTLNAAGHLQRREVKTFLTHGRISPLAWRKPPPDLRGQQGRAKQPLIDEVDVAQITPQAFEAPVRSSGGHYVVPIELRGSQDFDGLHDVAQMEGAPPRHLLQPLQYQLILD